MLSLSKCYQRYQVGTPSPHHQSHHHRLPFVLSYSSSALGDVLPFLTSHPDSFRSVISLPEHSSCNLLSHFRIGQTQSETFQVILDRLCVDLPTLAFSFFPQGDSLCLPSIFSLEPAFLQRGAHSFYTMLSL